MTKEPWEVNFAAFAPLVVASAHVVDPIRLPICYACRREPNNQYDSGWNFWSGTETQEFVDIADNFNIYPLNSFLEMDPSLRTIIESPIGAAWERTPGGKWTVVEPSP